MVNDQVRVVLRSVTGRCDELPVSLGSCRHIWLFTDAFSEFPVPLVMASDEDLTMPGRLTFVTSRYIW